LHLGVATGKVIEGLGAGLSSEDGEGEVMILEVETNTGEVDYWLDSHAAELLRVAYEQSVPKSKADN
jgi:hypothetical protein